MIAALDPYMIATWVCMVTFVAVFAALAVREVLSWYEDDPGPWIDPYEPRDTREMWER